MGEYFLDLALVALFVIGITATVGVITNSVGNFVFGRSKRTEFVDQSNKIQANWNMIGGKTKK